MSKNQNEIKKYYFYSFVQYHCNIKYKILNSQKSRTSNKIKLEQLTQIKPKYANYFFHCNYTLNYFYKLNILHVFTFLIKYLNIFYISLLVSTTAHFFLIFTFVFMWSEIPFYKNFCKTLYKNFCSKKSNTLNANVSKIKLQKSIL